jgi:hypothetical protein
MLRFGDVEVLINPQFDRRVKITRYGVFVGYLKRDTVFNWFYYGQNLTGLTPDEMNEIRVELAFRREESSQDY